MKYVCKVCGYVYEGDNPPEQCPICKAMNPFNELKEEKVYADEHRVGSAKGLDEKVVDHKNGSWFHQLDKNNNLLTTVWPGKCDLYHALQATMIPYNDLVGVSIARAVKAD
jgi:mannose/cellobiose epimerase-like protein (N-acyl-D-glucosamine 2-epimerase family)